VRECGDQLRSASFADLLNELGETRCETSLVSPIGLEEYSFNVLRARLADGAVRVLVRGERKLIGGVLVNAVLDSFEKLPDGTVREIP
jgi:hypothetical protein